MQKTIIFILILPTLLSFSYNPVFQPTNKFIQTGTYSVDTTTSYSNNPTFTITFINPQTTSFKYITNIQTLSVDFTPTRDINLTTFACNSDSTSITTCVLSSTFSYVKKLNYRYIALSTTFNKITHFYRSAYFYTTSGGTTIVTSATPIKSNFNLPAISLTGNVKVWIFINGFNLTASSASNTIRVGATGTYLSSTSLQITFNNFDSSPLDVKTIMYSIIGVNIDNAALWPFPAGIIYHVSLPINSSFPDVSNSTQTSMQRQLYNTFWGVSSLSTSNRPSIQFQSSIDASKSVSTSSLLVQSANFNILVLIFKYCNSSAPYYKISTDTCYDICPDFQYEANTDMTCKNCVASAYDCQKCNQTAFCTICNTTNRILDAVTGRCNPKDGFYESGVYVPLPCDSNCTKCITAATQCTQCVTTHYLSASKVCLPCAANCVKCNSDTDCTLCTANYVISSGLCVLNYNCSLITDCNTCLSTTGCTQCVTGTHLINPTNCSSQCGDGYVFGTQQCDDNNNSDGDGCSQTCTIQQQYACTISSNLSTCVKCTSRQFRSVDKTSCNNCGHTCLTCTSSTSCSTCPTTRNMSASNQCNPNPGYYDDGSSLDALICDTSCMECSGGTNNDCTACKPKFYLSSNKCLGCISHCQNCIDGTSCTLCQNNYVIATNNTCVYSINCSSINDCNTCDAANGCTVCVSGTNLTSPTQCLPVCGDGYVFGTQICDDNNTIDGDGCSSLCMIQNNYVCTISSNKSTCVLCLNGTYPSSNKTACLTCDYDCFSCIAPGSCFACPTTRILNTSTNKCNPKSGHYDDGSSNNAIPCDTSCSQCSGGASNNCTACSQTKALNVSQCVSCNNAGKSCKKCAISGLSLVCNVCPGNIVSGLCNEIVQSSGSSFPLALLIALPILALLLCCCCLIFCLWRRRKNQQNKVEQQLEKGENLPLPQQTFIQQTEPIQSNPFTQKQLDMTKMSTLKKGFNSTQQKKNKSKKRKVRTIQNNTGQNKLNIIENPVNKQVQILDQQVLPQNIPTLLEVQQKPQSPPVAHIKQQVLRQQISDIDDWDRTQNIDQQRSGRGK